MNTKLSTKTNLATTTVGLLLLLLLSQGSNAERKVAQSPNSNYPPKSTRDRVTFYCGETLDKTNGKNIPATLAYVPQRRANIPIIAWQSNYIPEWDAQRRCEAVSPKFQAFYEDGRLNYLTNGVSRGYPIICAAREQGQPCTGEEQLFQIKPSSNPQEILQSLTDSLAGKSSEILYQSPGGQIYISVEELLKNKPAIED